ncbi:MAG: VOC family protein [Xanthomonadales bacterium]|nr:VOC family protein [Xanthomonadales bacterium]
MADPRNNQIDYIEFQTPNMASSRAFYSQVFGWPFTEWGEDYVSFEDGRLAGGLCSPEASGSGSNPLVVFFFEDLEALRGRVQQAGGKIVKDIFAFPGGHRFHFTEPGGLEMAAWSDRDADAQ